MAMDSVAQADFDAQAISATRAGGEPRPGPLYSIDPIVFEVRSRSPVYGDPFSEGIHLTPDEWSELGDIAMGLYGVMRLIESDGFDESSGAKELLELTYRHYEATLSRIRGRVGDEEDPGGG